MAVVRCPVGAFDGPQTAGDPCFAGGDGLAVAAAEGAFGKALTELLDLADVGFSLVGMDGRTLLASGWSDGTVRLSDPVTGTPVGEPFTGHTSDVTSVAFGPGPGGRLLLASGSTDKHVRLWEPASGRCAAILRRRSSVRSIAMASRLLAIGDDEGVSVIDLDE